MRNWHATFNPYGFAASANWLACAERTEDILQLQHVREGLTIDVGFYDSVFRGVVIKEQDWEAPLETFQSQNPAVFDAVLSAWMAKYA